MASNVATKRWAAEAFKIMVWQTTFMAEGTQKDAQIHFLLSAPDEVKAECIKLFGSIPGL